MDFSKIIVVMVIVLNILFTVAVLWVFMVTNNEPTALVTAWFAFTVGELWLLAGIKKTKTKHEAQLPWEGDFNK